MEVTQDNRFDIAPETKLWRYMSFAKFAALLHDKKLILSPAYKFDDPYEGAGGIARNLDRITEAIVCHVRKTIPDDINSKVTDEDFTTYLKGTFENARELGYNNRFFTFVNCWHENEAESEAMWKLYTASQPDGIAIQTTYGALVKAINNTEAKIGRITYEDYEVAFFPGDSYFWYKRKSFEHEREVRIMFEADEETRDAMAKDYKRGSIFVPLEVDLDVLIENIYVSPFASDWLKDVVKTELKLNGLEKTVSYSKMNERAWFFPTREQWKETFRLLREMPEARIEKEMKEE